MLQHLRLDRLEGPPDRTRHPIGQMSAYKLESANFRWVNIYFTFEAD